MAARTLDKMRKAQSLLRECHDWFVEKDETLLAVELCQIEGSLALFFENRCFANTPCPGLQQEELPRLPPYNGYKRRIRRGTYNGYRRAPPAPLAPPANMDRTEASTGRAGGGQNVRAQPTASTSKGIVSNSNCPGAIPKAPRALSAVTRVSPPTGVLLDFNDGVECVQLSPSVVANMETAQKANLETKGRERLSGGSDQPAPGVEVRLDGDDKPSHKTIVHVAHAAPADPGTPASSHCSPPAVEGVIPISSRSYLPGSPACDSPEDGLPHTSQTYQPVNGINGSEKCNFKNCEESPVPITTGGATEGMLVNLDDDLAVILPAGTDAGTDSTIHSEEKDVLAVGLGSGVEQNHQSDDSEDDEIVFQGNAEKALRPDFKALFVSSDDDSQTDGRLIDLKAIFEKYSEVVICK
ncbi:hypothetical protein N7516_004624 [Penicillium verrucosum]|uniref:uncharacterized protein n=1 Tax=Penicillium verrucosum TaxID=60171 RepID=UPI0025451B5D|nr:uncharacterized protein N7516_004624 [Penicillium verrucosum]KAJ5944456.1 hypothetical protein N7516_004624 [Penicillium verrucosum]